MNDTEQWRRLADSSARWWQSEDEGAVALRTAADTVDRLNARIATLEAVEKAARELRDNAEEYDCEGLGLFAQHGYWQPLHDALDEIDDRAAAALGDNDGR